MAIGLSGPSEDSPAEVLPVQTQPESAELPPPGEAPLLQASPPTKSPVRISLEPALSAPIQGARERARRIGRLARSTGRQAYPTISNHLINDPSADVRETAAYALAVYRGASPDVITDLLRRRYADEPVERVKLALLEGVGRQAGRGAAAFLIGIIESDSAIPLRLKSAAALARAGSAETVSELERIEASESDPLVLAAVTETRMHLAGELDVSMIRGCAQERSEK